MPFTFTPPRQLTDDSLSNPFAVTRDVTNGRWYRCILLHRSEPTLYVDTTEFLTASEAWDDAIKYFKLWKMAPQDFYLDYATQPPNPPVVVKTFPVVRSPNAPFSQFVNHMTGALSTTSLQGEPPTAADPVAEAVRAERGSIYGDPFLNHKGIAMMWASLLAPWWESIRDYKPLPPHVVALLFAALKLNRMRLRFHEDNYVDLHNYANSFAREWQRQYQENPPEGYPPDATR